MSVPLYLVIAYTDFGTCEKGAKLFYDSLTNIHAVTEVRWCRTGSHFLQELAWLKTKLNNHQTCLGITYYSGHGNQVRDASGDEIDGLDEIYQFPDTTVTDDQMTQVLLSNTTTNVENTSTLLVVSDCCSSGSALDNIGTCDTTSKGSCQKWITLGATTDKEDAFLDGDGPVFTQTLVGILHQVLTTKAQDIQGILTQAQERSWIGRLQNFTVKYNGPTAVCLSILD